MRYLKYTCRIRKFKAFEPACDLLKRTFCYKRCIMSLYRPIKAQYSANVVAASIKTRIFRISPVALQSFLVVAAEDFSFQAQFFRHEERLRCLGIIPLKSAIIGSIHVIVGQK